MKFDQTALRVGSSPLRDAAVYLFLAIALSWLVWIPGVLLSTFGASGVGNLLLALGSFVPLLVALYLNRLGHRKTLDWASWFRTLTLNRLIVALVLPFLILVPLILVRLYNQNFDLFAFAKDFARFPVMFVGLLVLAFGEEVGWRGFLLSRLEPLNIVVVNFLVAFAWFAWQIPLLMTQSSSIYQNDTGQLLASFLLFSLLITPFFNRLSRHAGLNVLLPSVLRAAIQTTFAVYLLQGGGTLLTHPYGVGALAWLAVLNVLLFGQLWLGKPSGNESELARVMPLEPALK